MMGHLSSKNFIKLHALFLFALAAYLTSAPEVITDSDLVSWVDNDVRIVGFLPVFQDILLRHKEAIG
jgi:hypothetical protein